MQNFSQFFLAAQHWFFSVTLIISVANCRASSSFAAKLLKVSQQASCEWHVRERERERERLFVGSISN